MFSEEKYLSMDNQVHMSYFSHCCYKILRSKHPTGAWFDLVLQFEGTVRHGGRSLRRLLSIECDEYLCSACFLFFSQLRAPVDGMMSLGIKLALLTSINLI